MSTGETTLVDHLSGEIDARTRYIVSIGGHRVEPAVELAARPERSIEVRVAEAESSLGSTQTTSAGTLDFSFLSSTSAVTANAMDDVGHSLTGLRVPSNLSAMTDQVRRLSPILHAIVASKASRAGLPLGDTFFDIERDDEEDSQQLVMVVEVKASGIQALAFWESLDVDMRRWLESLSERDRELVTDRLGLRFAWQRNRPAR